MMPVAEHQLYDLHQKLQPENRKEITKKHPPGKPHQISNTEGWVRKVQFGGSVLLPRYKVTEGFDSLYPSYQVHSQADFRAS
jgi:hypothetical protein